MTNIDSKKIDKAREWARDNLDGGYFHGGGRALAAAKIILSLPDQIIDAEKVRDVINHHRHVMHQGLENDLEALITSPLPTLAELIEQGHDPAQYQWVQAEHRDRRCIIVRMDGHTSQPAVSLLTAAGATIWASTDEVIPHPDKPRLVWPASEPEPAEETPDEPERTYAPGGVVVQEALDKLNTPEPQEGEAWEVVYAIAGSEPFNVIYGNNGNAFNFRGSKWKQAELIPMHRLVPEVDPKVLVTEEDYENAPEGTVIEDGRFSLYTSTSAWYTLDGKKYAHRDLAGTPRRVLRWGMGEQA